VNKIVPGTVTIGYVHPNIVTEGFARSLAQACLWQDNKIVGIISASSPRQHVARNSVITKFLEGPAEWLMWIDTDMTFEPSSIDRLRRTAHKKKADMVAGLAFIYKRHESVIQPNAFMWDAEGTDFVSVNDYTSGSILKVDAAGSAFVLINRKVLENTGPHWHENWMYHPSNNGPMGHDLAFFYNACVTLDYKLVYDTNIKAGHIKHFELNEDSFRSYQEMGK